MSRTKIFAIYIAVDLLIMAGVVWCVFQHLPVDKYLIPAFVLFVLNGIWLVMMTVKNTPPRSS